MLFVFVLPASDVAAEEVSVPVGRQADLLVRVAAYDRRLQARAAGTVRVVIVERPDDADSRAVATQMDRAIHRFDKIATLPYETTTVAWTNGVDLAARCRAQRASIVYFAPGLDGVVAEAAKAFEGADVLSAGALSRYVQSGVVLGFDLVSGRPTLVINLQQAKKQNVDIEADVLSLMRIVR